MGAGPARIAEARMMPPDRRPTTWPIAVLLYRALLVLFPRRFREAFGTEMADAFAARVRTKRHDAGVVAALGFCFRNYLDTIRAAAAEHVSRSTPADSGPAGTWRLDLRHAARSLIARPGFSLVVVLTLALAIGANTAMYSVLHAVLFNPLPFRDPDRIVVLGEYAPAIDTPFVSPVTYDDWKTRNEAFTEIAAFRYWETVNLEDTAHEPESINLVTASANFFDVLGIQPAIGRTYREEQHPQGGSEAVISHDLWQRRYSGDPSVLGKAIRVRGTTTTVVGIMPPTSLNLSLGWGDVWTCLYRYNIQEQRATSYRARYLSIAGRLKPGLSLEQARLRMTTLQHQLWREPSSVAVGYEVRLTPIAETLTGRARPGLLVLFGAVGLVLLIACANIANLMLVRATARQRETAVRLALGASTWQLVRLLLAESLLLAALGAAGGVGVAWGSLIVLRDLRPDIPRIADTALTPGVLAFTLAIAVASALLFSLAPLAAMTRRDVRGALSDGGRGGSDGAGSGRLRRLLVACQMALACVLLVSGGLLLRSLDNLLHVDTGFRPQNAVIFDLYLPNSRYPKAADHTRFYRELVRELGETPGVQSAGGLLYFPYKPKLWLSSLWVETAPVPDGEKPIVYYNLAAGDYFQAMGIPLKAGRWPTTREMWEEPRVVVVNEALARQVFPRQNPLGKRIRTGTDGPWHEVVGVVGDVRQKRLDEPPKPEFYETFAAMPMPFLSLVVRTHEAPERMLSVVRAVIRQRDPGLAVANLAPLAAYVESHTADRRFALVLLAMFAALALALGAIGVYGVMSYSVAQRQREIAIRLALGAVPAGVRSMVVRDGLRVVGSGAVVGLAAAALASRLLRSQLFGVNGFDPLIYAVVPSTLILVAAIATWLPARRASRIEAIHALRGE
jgi:putative ABC transport system permease protein